LVRAVAEMADSMAEAGYAVVDITRIRDQEKHFVNVRNIIRLAAEEVLDLKPYEADMRHLIDTYIEADVPRTITPFDDMTLLQVITSIGIENAIRTKLGLIAGNKAVVEEIIANNVRKKIVKEQMSDPVYYEKMSALLQELIELRKQRAIEYEEYLRRIAVLAKQVETGKSDDTPEALDTPGKRALWNNLGNDLALALKVDTNVRRMRPEGWRDIKPREQVVRRAIYDAVRTMDDVDRIFQIVKAQPEY
jgi:type I restriction enzyme R subunit